MSLLVERRKLDHFQKIKTKKDQQKTYQSNFELTSKENVDSIGVIASSAVCRSKDALWLWTLQQVNRFISMPKIANNWDMQVKLNYCKKLASK